MKFLSEMCSFVSGSSNVFIMSPYQKSLGKLRLERLQLEETKLLELKRITELERIRGPKPKWLELNSSF